VSAVKQYLDASVVVRHLTGSPPDQFARARALITSGAPLWVTETALLETAYVLERLLGKPREEVVDALVAFLREPNIHLQGLATATVLQALLYCRPSRRVSFGDALMGAMAHDNGGEIYTFDARFPPTGVTQREP
jgi:predicted nucleic acid-binding protein